METIDSAPKLETVDVEVDAETSTNEKPLSKGARKRRNKRIKNQQPEESNSSIQQSDGNGKTKKKLSDEEKSQRKKLFVSELLIIIIIIFCSISGIGDMNINMNLFCIVCFSDREK